MRLFQSFRPLALGGALLLVPVLCGANGNGCGPSEVPIGGNGGGGGSSPVMCAPSSCGPEPQLVEQCPGGGTVGPVCEQDDHGNCAWVVPPCPAQCTPAMCGGEPNSIEMCPDGTVHGPVCGLENGQCGWFFPPCPSTCGPGSCGPEPPVPACPGGGTVTPVCEKTDGGPCGWYVPPCPSQCVPPNPLPCNSIIECSCVDGTTQIGGCPNGFTCPQACCMHGGAK